MTREGLIPVHRVPPFQSFRVHYADGGTWDVPDPECLAHAPNAPTIKMVRPYESFEVIELPLVTAVEVLNGSGHRRASKP